VGPALRERSDVRRRQKPVHEAAIFGKPAPGAIAFKLTRYAQNGSAERCQLPENGIATENFPLSYLHVAKIRQLWGPGTYRGQWMGHDENGRWKGCGRMAEVQILPTDANGRAMPGGVVRALAVDRDQLVTTGVGAPFEHYPPRLPPREEPPEVIDVRIKAEREISKMRLDAEREITEQRQRARDEQTAAEFQAIRSELAMVRSSRRGDDDDDGEPGPWDWLGPFFEKLRPTLEELIPPLLSRLAKKAVS